MDETNQELQGSERQKTQTYQDTYFWLLASASVVSATFSLLMWSLGIVTFIYF